MSIQKRTVFVDTNTGVMRFWDWAVVTTTLGTMVEPFLPNARHSNDVNFIDFDPADEIARVDSIRGRDIRDQNKVLSGGGDAIHGGTVNPKTGR